MNNFSRACPSGNTMIDCAPREPREMDCWHCDGSGKVPYENMIMFSEALFFKVEELKNKNLHPRTFKQLLQLARCLKNTGMGCPSCDGTGEVYV